MTLQPTKEYRQNLRQPAGSLSPTRPWSYELGIRYLTKVQMRDIEDSIQTELLILILSQLGGTWHLQAARAEGPTSESEWGVAFPVSCLCHRAHDLYAHFQFPVHAIAPNHIFHTCYAAVRWHCTSLLHVSPHPLPVYSRPSLHCARACPCFAAF